MRCLPHFYDKLPYDTFKDFTPISQIGSSPNMLLVRADSPFKSVGDVIAAARAKPGVLSYGHAGNGTSPYLSGELFKYMAKVEITPVPYKGGAPVLIDLIGGQIPLTFNNIPESLGSGPSRRGAPARRHHRGALAGAAQCADHRRVRCPRLRHRRVVGRFRAGRIARGDPGQTRQGLRRCGADAGHAGANCYSSARRRSARRRTFSPRLTRDDYDKWGPVIKAAGLKID